jgi:hypothetical protein
MGSMARRVHKSDSMPTQAEFLAARPAWSGTVKARSFGPRTEKWVLHAGPPFEAPGDIPAPVRNSLIAAIRFEAWACTDAEAWAEIERGRVALHPAQDFDIVTPLAFPVSPSMSLMRVGQGAAPFNEGSGAVLRLGSPEPEARERLDWIERVLAPAFAFLADEPVDLLARAKAALDAGDDLHASSAQASSALARDLAPRLAPAVTAFLAQAPAFFLNLTMAMAREILAYAPAGLVTAMGGNGHRFGFKRAGEAAWTTTPATPPLGPVSAPGAVLPAIGDSAVVEAFGLGAMAAGTCPAPYRDHGPWLPPDSLRLREEILATTHPVLGLRVGLDTNRISQTKQSPVVSLAMLATDGSGRLLGRGIYRPDPLTFVKIRP